MNPLKSSLLLLNAAVVAALTFATTASAQLIAYDDAGSYQTNGNWTNGANLGFGFTPWVFTTIGPDNHGTYLNSGNNPAFVIASITNFGGVNYTNIWGTYANGTNGVNETTVYRGFASSLGTNTFKLQWGSRGAGVTAVNGQGNVHGWCGFTLRNGNATNSADDFNTGARLYIYFKDGVSPSTVYVWDGDPSGFPLSLTGTSFSDLGRQDITNALEAEITVADDNNSYHLVLKDCVLNKTLYTLDSVLMGSGTIDSAALFNQETTGDQIYNRMQIAVPHIPPSVVNIQPANGSIYLDASANALSFEVDSLHSMVQSSAVSVTLNSVPQTVNYNTASPTAQLLGNWTAALAPNTFYTLQIVAQDANGDTTTNVSTFNTFLASNLYIDAYDYNYGSGQYFDTLAPANLYAGRLGSNGIDYLETDLSGTNNLYRPTDLPQVLDQTADTFDHANVLANGHSIYNLGFTDVGEWQNFTRTVPVNTNYSIYARAASAGTGLFEIEELTNSTVTTSSQAPVALGRVNVPNSGGSRTFSGQLTPLTDIFGNTVVVPLSGTKTYRTTAISSRGYNLEYLVFVPVTNAAGPLGPYIAAASPAPNATGVPTISKIGFTIVNRQTTVSSVQLLTNGVSAGNVVGTNFNLGTTNFFSPGGLLPNATNTITVIITDNTGALTTNTWSFVAAPLAGNGVWSGGGSPNLTWANVANWTGGMPGPAFTATFANPGSTTNLVTNNIVAANATILGLSYQTNSGYHTTLIPDGVTLTVSNPTNGIATPLQVGNDVPFNKKTTNTITGLGGTLLVTGPLQLGSNSLNFQVRQCASGVAIPNLVTFDMSGLGTMIANVGKFYVAQGGSGGGQSNVSGCVFLARTNTINLLRVNAGQFEVGDSSGGAITLPGSSLYMGITNTIFVDTMRIGKQKATNNLMTFNPSFLGYNPSVVIRGTNGMNSRSSVWTIGDADTDTVAPINVDGTCDFSGGRLDALVKSMIVGEGCTSASDSARALGILTFTAGTLDVNNLTNGIQRGTNTATEVGIINVNGTANLVSPNITLAQAQVGANASLVSGTLNVTNGTVRGNIIAGGGVSTVNVSGGTLAVTQNAGTQASALSALNLSGASLHLNLDGNATTVVVNATSVTASGTTLTIDSISNVAGNATIHLISYTGATPFAGLSLAPLPAGYTGNLVDNGGSIDLNLVPSAPPANPTIGTITISSGQVVISGTNNAGAAGGTFKVLTSTNLAVPGWSILTNGSFDSNGRFSVTNSAGTNGQRFFRLEVP